MNKLIRPCTLPSVWVGVLDGKDSPFVIDAVRFEGLHYTPSTSYNPEEYFIVRVDLCNPRTTVMAYHPKENVEHLMRRTLGVIHDALNAPVQVTQEVLDAAKEEYLDDSYYYRIDENARFLTDETFLRNVNPIHLSGMEIVPACPLSLDFLLQFYTDGTPVKGKETE